MVIPSANMAKTRPKLGGFFEDHEKFKGKHKDFCKIRRIFRRTLGLHLILTLFFKGAAALDTQELLKTPSQDSMKVDDGIAQEMLAALEESEGKFHN